MESATSQEEADVLGAYSDSRTPFKFMLMDEKLFFHPWFLNKKRKEGEECSSLEARSIWPFLTYWATWNLYASSSAWIKWNLWSSLNTPTFAERKNSRLNRRAAVKYSSYWLSSPQSLPGKPLTRSTVEHAQDSSLSQHKLSVTNTITLLQLKRCFAANYHKVKTRLSCNSVSQSG